MAYDGSLIFDTKVDTKGFQKGSNTLKGQAGGLAGSFKKLGKVIAGAFIVKKAFDIGKQAVGLASDIQEVQNVVDTAFGEMSYKMEEFAKTSIETFGISKLTAKQTGSTFMAMSVGMGIAQDSASDMAIALTGLSADMSSFYNKSQDITSTALKSIFTGETETLKQFGIVMTEANLEAYALSKGITKSYQAMSQAEKVQLRYNFVMNQTKLAQGDFAKTSDSWANQTRMLTEKWKEFLSIIGTGLIKVLSPVVKALNTVMTQLINFAQSASTLLSGLFGEDKAKNQQKTTKAIEGSVSATNDLADAQEDVNKAVKKGVAGFDELNSLDTSPKTGGATGSAGSTVSPIASVSADTSKIDSFSKKLSPILENIKTAFLNFGFKVKPLIDTISDVLMWFYNNVLVPFGKWVGNKLVPAFLDALGSAAKFLNSVLQALKPLALWLWDSFLQPIAKWTGGLIVGILEGLSKALSKIGDWIKNNQTAFSVMTGIVATFFAVWEIAALGEFIINAGGVAGIISKLTKVIKACTIAKLKDKAETLALIGLYIKDFAVSFAKAIASFVTQTAAVIANTAAKIANTVAQVAMTVATGAWNVICGIATVVTTAFGAAVAFLTSPIGLVVLAIGAIIAIVVLLIKNWDTVKEVTIKVWNAIVDFIKGIVDSIVKFFKGLWDGIKSIFSKVAEFFIGQFTASVNGIKTVFGAIGNFFSGIWNGIKNIFSSVKDFFVGQFVASVNGIKTAFSVVGSFFSSVWEGIKRPFVSVADWFGNIFSKAWQAVKDVFSTGGKIFDGIKDGILSVFKTVVNGIIGGINKVISIPFDGINWALKKIKGISIAGLKPFDWISTIKVPQIPKLATGTVVPANYGEFMAVLGDNKKETEVVSPLSTMKQAFKEAQAENGNGRPIVIVLKVGAKEFARVCIDSINELTRLTGQLDLDLV